MLGSLVVLFENSVGAVGPSIVSGLQAQPAAALIHHIHNATAISAIEPDSILGDIGLALLGIAALRARMPRWAAVAIAVGALGEGAGFGSSTKGLVIGGFAIMLIGVVQAVRALTASRSAEPAEATGAIRTATALSAPGS